MSSKIAILGISMIVVGGLGLFVQGRHHSDGSSGRDGLAAMISKIQGQPSNATLTKDMTAYVDVASKISWTASPHEIYQKLGPVAHKLSTDLEQMPGTRVSDKLFMGISDV